MGDSDSSPEDQLRCRESTVCCRCGGCLGKRNLFVRGFPRGSKLRLADATLNAGRAISCGCSSSPAALPWRRALVSSWATANFQQAECKATQWLKYPYSLPPTLLFQPPKTIFVSLKTQRKLQCTWLRLVDFFAFRGKANYSRERDENLKGSNNKLTPLIGFTASMQVRYYMVRQGVWKADAVSAIPSRRDFQQLERRRHLRMTGRITGNQIKLRENMGISEIFQQLKHSHKACPIFWGKPYATPYTRPGLVL